jgi:hypothetical protein
MISFRGYAQSRREHIKLPLALILPLVSFISGVFALVEINPEATDSIFMENANA